VLADGRRDYLIIGQSGSGKSTLTVRLLAQGWACGGDDVVLLHNGHSQVNSAAIRGPNPMADIKSNAVRALALRRDFALSSTTLAYCPTLANTSATMAPVGEKQIVDVSRFVLALVREEFQPALLLFATIGAQAESRLESLAPTQALIALAQQSAGIMTNRAIGQRQLQLLARLCQQAPSHRLLLGCDVFTNPQRVAALLQAVS
jgi:ribose 1,5-bisphosphokinase PhnN